MNSSRKPTAEFSTEELQAELAKRRQREIDDRPPIIHCDECIHFVPLRQHMSDVSPKRGEKITDYNPCSKGHEMRFRSPLFVSDTDWGYYRPKCRDRATTS